MQLVKKYIIENKKKLIIILVIGIIFTIVSFCINNQKDNKVYSSDDYVYTKESYDYDEYSVSLLPYINIKGKRIQEINNELLNQYYELIELKEKMMGYDYFINDNILSLIVKVYYIEAPDSYPNISIYNINIDNGKILRNDEILNFYNISDNNVEENIRNQIKEYYFYEIKNEYISNDCNFDCYLSSTKSLPLDEYQLYIKDEGLYAYKKLNLDRAFYYDTDSGFDLFNFKVA